MLLFLHGAYHTSSSLLPLIRDLLDLSSDYSDRFILDNFTIAIPGYHCNDKAFDSRYLQDSIIQFSQDKALIQQNIATQLILARSNPAILNLRQSKLTIIGYGGGGALALTFASQYPDLIESLTLLDVGIRFGNLKHWFKKRQAYRRLTMDLHKIQQRLTSCKDVYDKQFLSILTENTTRRGVRSYLDFVYNFDFQQIHNNLTLSQQHQFAKIPILSLLPAKNGLTSRHLATALGHLIHPDNTLVHKKHTIINTNSQDISNFEYRIVPATSNRLFEIKNIESVNTQILDFLKIS